MSKFDKNSRGEYIDRDREIDRDNVLQRITYYKTPSKYIDRDRARGIRKTRGFIVSVRLNQDELDMLDWLVSTRNTTLSKIIRDAITVLYGLLRGSENIETQTVVIQHPNVILNINENHAVNKSETKLTIDPEILEKKVKLLEREKRDLKEIIQSYEAEIERYKRDVKELEKRLRVEREARAALIGRIKYALEHPDLAEEILRKALEG